MVPDKFNMVDMDGIDLIMMQGEEIPGLYMRLVESIAHCRYQCLYNWFFDGVVIPPTYVRLEVNEDDEVAINEGVTVSPDDVIHIYSIEPPAPEPEIIPLLAEENGVYNVPTGKDGFNPVTVDVPSYTPVIQPITITENGTYNIPAGVDGYGPIVVNVNSGGDMELLYKSQNVYGDPYTNVEINDDCTNFEYIVIFSNYVIPSAHLFNFSVCYGPDIGANFIFNTGNVNTYCNLYFNTLRTLAAYNVAGSWGINAIYGKRKES